MVKRYEPAPGGGMIERQDGKYYHRRDVEDLLDSVIVTALQKVKFPECDSENVINIARGILFKRVNHESV